jgi:hypothetical protein
MVMSGSGAGTTPTIGARVVTVDADELGTVKEVVGSAFKVDASMQPDYWLACDCIAGTVGDEVRLSFPKDRLGEMKVEAPRDSGVYR